MSPTITKRLALTLVAVLLGLTSVAVVAQTGARAVPAAALTRGHLSIVVSQTPAFAGDAPDPDVVYSNGTYYAFTTGTPLGNHLQALIDTSGNPASGWRSYTGGNLSTALPTVPSWQTNDTQTSPGVFFYGGHWVMFYDASVSPNPIDNGHSCLSVATIPSLSPTPQFTDNSSGPLWCGFGGGVLDPSPFVDPATGAAYLVWKSNDGSSSIPSQVWSVRLGADGTTFAGTPTVLLTVDQADLPWETTLDNPQLVFNGGTYSLLFSAGDFLSASYSQALTACSGPLGPCQQPWVGPSSPPTGAWPARAGGHCSRMPVGAGGLATPVGRARAPTTRAGVCAGCSWRPSTSTTISTCPAIDRPGPLPATGSPPATAASSTSATFPSVDRQDRSSSTSRWWASPTPPTVAATGPWPGMGESSVSVTPVTSGRPGLSTSTSPSWAWPPPPTAGA
ncbi:MAG: family 43 glycosylhydrolase, partial [Acidimicrobiales bacterium]|nr:family 43 glycosylhydrolase [Acidimicrobiales bacterium]